MIEDIYNELPRRIRPVAKSLYLILTSTPRISLNKRIGHAVSDDLKNWERNPENPVFEPSEKNNNWDGVTVEDPDLLYKDGMFQMFYGGHNEYNWETKQIGVASSSTGDDWKRDPANPILSPDPEGWHNRSVQNPAVVAKDDSYHMIFDGSDEEDGWVGIGYANAESFSKWKQPSTEPVIGLGEHESWREEHVADPSLTYYDGTFHLYYAGRQNNTWRIGHATTTNFESIEQDTDNPVIVPEGDLGYYKHTNDPNVIHDGEKFHMLFAGNTGSVKQFEYATSKDGNNWDVHDGPVFTPDKSTGWEGTKLTNPGLVYDGTQYHLFYVGVTEE